MCVKGGGGCKGVGGDALDGDDVDESTDEHVEGTAAFAAEAILPIFLALVNICEQKDLKVITDEQSAATRKPSRVVVRIRHGALCADAQRLPPHRNALLKTEGEETHLLPIAHGEQSKFKQ